VSTRAAASPHPDRHPRCAYALATRGQRTDVRLSRDCERRRPAAYARVGRGPSVRAELTPTLGPSERDRPRRQPQTPFAAKTGVPTQPTPAPAWDDEHSSRARHARRSLSPGESSSLSSGDLRCRASSGATVSASVIRAPACSRGCFAKVRARGSAGVRGAFRALRGRGGLGGGAAGRPSRAFRAPLRPLRLLSGACGASVSCVLR